MDDAFLVQLLQPTVTTIEGEIGQLLGFEIEAKPETRAKKPMSESLYDQATLTLYYTQPEIQAGVDTVSEFASRSIIWDAKNDSQDKKIRAFWKKEMMRQKILGGLSASRSLLGRSGIRSVSLKTFINPFFHHCHESPGTLMARC